MKIKELHLRNIASIERADIDFTKDLTDGVTGDPASVFLISGDTGAGKSIILDGISMALYKTTPRLNSTSNKTRNTFADTSGEEISVGSITQYTRLGISPGEDSYSELVFEGNDSKTYTARLTLGVYLGNTSKSSGKRPLKHSKPKWELKVNGKVLPQKTDIEEVIREAVGLSFEQFGRMAMLAQGQFATFLTGDKKERESILEQLTNTEHFTSFGYAIKSLYDKASGEFKTAKMLFDAEKQHSIPPEELEELHKNRTEAETARRESEDKINSNQTTIDLVKQIAFSSNSLADALKTKAELEDKMNGEEYRQSVALAADWKATEEPRLRLKEMRTAIKAKSEVVGSEALLRDTFAKLSADLRFRKEEAAKKEEEIREQEVWLEKLRDCDTLYAEASAVELKIDSFIKTRQEITENKRQTKAENDKSGGLQKALAEAEKNAKAAAEAVNAKQQEITTLASQREQLNPEQTNRLLSEAGERKNIFSRMKTQLVNIEEDSKKASAQEQQIKEQESSLAELANKQTLAQQEHDLADKKYDESRNVYSTMQMSLDDKLVALRKKLVDEHTDTCPLCGQHIDKICIEDDFKELLSPLYEAQQQAKDEFEKTKKVLEDALKAHNSASGELTANRKSFVAAMADIEKKKSALNAEALTAGLDIAKELGGQLADTSDNLDKQISALKKQQQEAETLQSQIAKLIKEKESLDKAKTAADKEENSARKAMEDHKTALDRLAETAAKLVAERDKLHEEITAAMTVAYPDWAEDAADSRIRLKNDADKYNGEKKSLTENRSAYELLLKEIENIEGQSVTVLGKHPDWNESSESRKLDGRDILGAWRKLVGDVQSASTRIEGFDETIRECSKMLDDYCRESGKSETDLDAIEAKRSVIEGVQKLIRETEAALQSRNDAIAADRKRIAESREKLGVKEGEEVPALDSLEDLHSKLTDEKDRVVGELSGIETRLKADSDNKKRVEDARIAMERAGSNNDKWGKLNSLFGGTRLRTLVQTYILRPLLINANLYLERITDRYTLTCSSENEQLSILVLDRYNKNQVRSVTVLSGGEKFMISLALSLALSSLNRPDMNVDILFIDEGFGTLDEKSLDSVMQTLERLQEIAGESQRRVGIISHREELNERIPVQVEVVKKGEGRSIVRIKSQ